MITPRDYENPYLWTGKLAAELRRALRRKDLSQSDVGRKLGWSQPATSRFFHGQVNVSYRKILLVLAATETPPVEFFRRLCPLGKRTGSSLAGAVILTGLGNLLVHKGVISRHELVKIQDDLTRYRNDD